MQNSKSGGELCVVYSQRRSRRSWAKKKKKTLAVTKLMLGVNILHNTQ